MAALDLLKDDAAGCTVMTSRAEAAIAAMSGALPAHARRARALSSTQDDAATCLLRRRPSGIGRRGAAAAALAPSAALYGRIAEAKFARAVALSFAPSRDLRREFHVRRRRQDADGDRGRLSARGPRRTSPASSPAATAARARGPVKVSAGEARRTVGRRAAAACGGRADHDLRRPRGGRQGDRSTDATVIVMDDGFQNPGLAKDLSLIVVDAGLGIGNGLVMPAGPLRAPLDAQIAHADALIIIGTGGNAAPLEQAFAARGKPVVKARMVPRQDKRWLGVLPVIAFAGIAAPEKFYATLGANGARVLAKHSFGDHHRYTRRRGCGAARKRPTSARPCWSRPRRTWCGIPDDDGTPLGELKHSLPSLRHRHRVRGRSGDQGAAREDARHSLICHYRA